MKRTEIIACLDAMAMEIANKISEYEHLRDQNERMRALVMGLVDESVPRNLDTHELVSRRFGRRAS